MKNNSLLFIKKENFYSNNNDHSVTYIFENEDFFNKLLGDKNKILVHNLDEFYIKIINHIYYHEDFIDVDNDLAQLVHMCLTIARWCLAIVSQRIVFVSHAVASLGSPMLR